MLEYQLQNPRVNIIRIKTLTSSPSGQCAFLCSITKYFQLIKTHDLVTPTLASNKVIVSYNLKKLLIYYFVSIIGMTYFSDYLFPLVYLCRYGCLIHVPPASTRLDIHCKGRREFQNFFNLLYQKYVYLCMFICLFVFIIHRYYHNQCRHFYSVVSIIIFIVIIIINNRIQQYQS